jgi:hypothetical protein
MKTARSLLILLASIAMLSAEDYGSLIGKTYKQDAPNGRFSVQAHQEKGWGEFNVEIIELASNKTVLAFDPEARYIGAAWSPDSKLVAIEQNRTTHDSAVSVFSVGGESARRVVLPKDCNYEDEGDAVYESSTRKHAKIDNSRKFHITMADFRIGKWVDSGTLVLSASGRGWWGGDVAKDDDRRFEADYKLTIHFATDGTSSLHKTELMNYNEF